MELLSDLFSGMQQWLFETLVQPLLFHLGLGSILEDAYDGTMWLLLGVVQLIIMLAVFGPLQRWRPVEKIVDRTSVRLEPEMWQSLHEISDRERCTIHELCSLIQLKKAKNSSLTAAIRVSCSPASRSTAASRSAASTSGRSRCISTVARGSCSGARSAA